MGNKREKMTETEKRIFSFIVDEPMISQKQLAVRADISRSSASVHISSLMRKGYILGRGYRINEFKKIIIIGAAMVDLYGQPFEELKKGSQNPGKVMIYPGGVARNIAENLTRMGTKVSLITSLCNDPFGNVLKDNLEENDIDYSHSYFLDHDSSTLFMAMIDSEGEYKYVISDTRSLNKMPIDHLIRKESIIERSEMIILDAAISKDMLKYITDKYQEKNIIIDPVSPIKAKKMKSMIGSFYSINCNVEEASILTEINIIDKKSLQEAGQYFIDKGVERIFISLGHKGVYYQDNDERGKIDSYANKILNVTGASDAFTAGIAYGLLHNYSIKDTAHFASAASSIAIEKSSPVSSSITIKEINSRMNI